MYIAVMSACFTAANGGSAANRALELMADGNSMAAGTVDPLVSRWRRPSLIVVLPIAIVLTSVVGAAETLTLEEILDRASAYELAFIQRLSNVVAEEQYLQHMTTVSDTTPAT